MARSRRASGDRGHGAASRASRQPLAQVASSEVRGGSGARRRPRPAAELTGGGVSGDAARLPVALVLLVILMVLVVMIVGVVTAIAAANCGNGTPTTTVTAPDQSVQTMGEDTKYLESEGIPAFGAAGIVGNLMQESGMNPTEPGYGLAQWNPGWWALASAWISAHGQNPNSAGGQLMYIAANVLRRRRRRDVLLGTEVGSGARDLRAGSGDRLDE